MSSTTVVPSTRLQEMITSCESRLAIVEEAAAAELGKTYTARNVSLMEFLYKERAVYTFALSLLRSLQDD